MRRKRISDDAQHERRPVTARASRPAGLDVTTCARLCAAMRTTKLIDRFLLVMDELCKVAITDARRTTAWGDLEHVHMELGEKFACLCPQANKPGSSASKGPGADVPGGLERDLAAVYALSMFEGRWYDVLGRWVGEPAFAEWHRVRSHVRSVAESLANEVKNLSRQTNADDSIGKLRTMIRRRSEGRVDPTGLAFVMPLLQFLHDCGDGRCEIVGTLPDVFKNDILRYASLNKLIELGRVRHYGVSGSVYGLMELRIPPPMEWSTQDVFNAPSAHFYRKSVAGALRTMDEDNRTVRGWRYFREEVLWHLWIEPTVRQAFDDWLESRQTPEDEWPEIPNRVRDPYEQYEAAVAMPGNSDLTDEQAYDVVKGTIEESGDKVDLPDKQTWCRYVREYRTRTGTQKNKARGGRAGRSVVPAEDL